MMYKVMGVVAIVTVILTLSQCKASNKENKKHYEHECKYNDIKGCYNKACGFCSGRSQCNWSCEGDCLKCGGYIKREV